jgi:organic radical activating enzyme
MGECGADVLEVFSSIQGEGILVGEPQLFIRFCGCNLNCTYCDTAEARDSAAVCRVERAPGSSEFTNVANPVSADALADIVMERLALGRLYHSLVLTGGEPLCHSLFLSRFVPRLHRKIPVFLETNGTLWQKLRTVLHLIDMISMDIKVASATGQPTDWEAHRRFLQTGKEKTINVKATIFPSTDDHELQCVVDLVAAVDPDIPLVLQPVYQSAMDSGRGGALLAMQARCREKLHTVRVVPQVHKILKIL